MNAYELADLIEEDMEEGFGMGFLQDAVNMLRQQADRIAELSKNVDELEEELLKTPQTKELSDEEIYQEMIKCIDSPDDGHEFRYKDFARAILKKASE
jgi:hypothetical protein